MLLEGWSAAELLVTAKGLGTDGPWAGAGYPGGPAGCPSFSQRADQPGLRPSIVEKTRNRVGSQRPIRSSQAWGGRGDPPGIRERGVDHATVRSAGVVAICAAVPCGAQDLGAEVRALRPELAQL